MTSGQKPRAFRITPEPPANASVTTTPLSPGPQTRIVEEPFEIVDAADGVAVPVAPRQRSPWGALFLSAVGGLVSLGIGLSVERMIADLFQAAPWLGWVALALLALAALALLAIVVRELAGLRRERKIERLRQSAVDALSTRDHTGAQAVVQTLSAFYADRDSLSAGRARIDAAADAILDVDDRIGLAEHELLAGLDRQARNAIAASAKQVSAVTALSPRAIVDVAFVVFAAVRLLRRIAAIYGGRPGFLGFLRLARAAVAHLTVTGGMAVGESVMQQVLGLGIAARISAKLGEGVLNGLMTARFGLAALNVCRPLPFVRETPPRLADVAGELLRAAETESK
ncbi:MULTISPECIES: YcjF family protein [unclassified Methylobacterium]|jgi:putative membrane protein|uniref:YcjF family protein n=1 Tax=unclassified Methylobacterium TaxID=2615210 RepID=UPI0013530E81|nr:TIGR01620 family protein [Methylobacterium sp. 2A]MWV25300.1 TIGR01620 family protein [Methylobacterium sp. 2A]